jgi:hypothetical protein
MNSDSGCVIDYIGIGYFMAIWIICPVIAHVDYGCIFYYSPYLPWIWMAVEAPSQLIFPTASSYAAYQQYNESSVD